SAVRVPYEDDGTILRRNHELGRGDVVAQRLGRVLNDADVIAIPLEDPVNGGPTGSVHEPAVNQHDAYRMIRFHDIAWSNGHAWWRAETSGRTIIPLI